MEINEEGTEGLTPSPTVSVITDVSVGKIYKPQIIWFGSMLGGPMVVGYMIASNFKALGEPAKASKTWIYAIFASIVIFTGVFFIPDNVNIPNMAIPLLYTAIAAMFVDSFQKRQILRHIASNGGCYTWGRAVWMGLVGAIVTLGAVLSIYFLFISIE